MEATNTPFSRLLEGRQHYRVPLFQRTYTWAREEWLTLWNDLIEIYEMGSSGHHFLGSLVTKSLPSTPEGTVPYLVIDGQQRLTTLTILLAVLRDALVDNNKDEADKIHELYLTNRYVSTNGRFKLLPTQSDREAYFAIIDGRTPDSSTLLGQAYEFFHKQVAESDPVEEDGEVAGVDLQRLEDVILNKLELVSITLGESDNEYRIFESLNYKGTPLSQADLLRNFFFMQIPEADHETAYNELWLPMQDDLGVDRLEDFFRYEYMSDGIFIRQGDVYDVWRKRLSRFNGEQLIDELLTIAHHSSFYKRIVDPLTEPNEALSSALQRLNRWGAQTTYPFLMYSYREFDAGKIDAAGFLDILRNIESFLVRRALAGVPPNQLNRLFIRLSQQTPDGKDLVQGTKEVLSAPSRRWPTDDEFRAAILTYPLFTDSRGEQRRVILESLESSFGHKERVDFTGLTVEHVMPQTLTPAWREMLGSTVDDIHKRLLHTLGNLTLTGYNPELSNSPFSVKRTKLAESNLAMNKEIAREDAWTDEHILERGRRLADRAIQIWPGPDRD